ncbi:MAG: pseudaminic acid synthase [Candidatus Omnitrophota bacterium]
MNQPMMRIRRRTISPGKPAYIIAELSANHGQRFDRAVKLIEAAKAAGADAVKLQTYTADTITLNSHAKCFRVKQGLLWSGKNLYDLYREASTPWSWQPKLKKIADRLKIDLFSSPFDASAVDFLEKMQVPAYKIASFELVDVPLIEKIARLGKPMILSTGMATFQEIQEAVAAIHRCGNRQIALLKCTSAYPAHPSESHLRTIPDLYRRFSVPIGLSDHTMGWTVPVAAVALGACIVEKHLTLSRTMKGPDSAFSMEPEEFKKMVQAVWHTQMAMGTIHYGPTASERKTIRYRRSLFAVRDIVEGEKLTPAHVRSIRPAAGLPPKYYKNILGRKARCHIRAGTPLNFKMIR